MIRGFISMGMFGMPAELDVVLLRGRAAYVNTAGRWPTIQSEDAGLTSMICKKAISLQDFPLKPGSALSLWAWFCHQASPWHPLQMVVNRGVNRQIRKRVMTDSWLHIRWHSPVLPLHLLLHPSYARNGHRDRMLSTVFASGRWYAVY